MELISENNLAKFLISLSMIIVFISLKASPAGNYIEKKWWIWLIAGIIVFTYAHQISRKIKSGGII